jgi:hypothetical protein
MLRPPAALVAAIGLMPVQQLFGSTIIFGSIAEGIGNNQSTYKRRQQLVGISLREPFRAHLAQAHLEEALHFRRNLFREILGGCAKDRAGAYATIGVSGSSEGISPHSHGIGIFLQLLVDQAACVFRPAPNNSRREFLLRREVVVDARALDANLRSDFPKAKAAEAAELDAPLGSIHDCSSDVARDVPPKSIFQ